MKKQTKYNFLKIVDKQYNALIETLFAIVHGTNIDTNDWNGSVRVLQEGFTEYNENFVNETFEDLYVIVATDDLTESVRFYGLCESKYLARVYVGKGGSICETTLNDKIFENCDIQVYRYMGSAKSANAAMNEAISISQTKSPLNETVNGLQVLDILENAGIKYNFNGITNSEYPMNEFVEVDIEEVS